MIRISGNSIAAGSLASQYPAGSIQRKAAETMYESSLIYHFDTQSQLEFELNLRAEIVKAAKELHKSRMAFRVFRKAKCNEELWTLTEEGGFLLRQDANPKAAVRDIFTNGTKYGTECATAVIIVYYGAIAGLFPEDLFNRLFGRIYLMNWKRLDPGLGVRTLGNITDDLPGDCRYFKNPDVNLLNPEWQGENAIDLGDGTYYGHGVGIATADKIIDVLNSLRKSDATQSAYMSDTATRPGFKRLADAYSAPYPEAGFFPERLPARLSWAL